MGTTDAGGQGVRLLRGLVGIGLGYRKRFWLHVPVGVGLFGWLTRQLNRLNTLRRTAGTRP